MLYLLVAGLVATVVIVESDEVCPTEPPSMMYACLPVPKCSGDASCGVGQGCCPHTCGARCATLVHCDPVDCGALTCSYGFQKDSRGCKTCTCRTSKPCTGAHCLLTGTIG